MVKDRNTHTGQMEPIEQKPHKHQVKPTFALGCAISCLLIGALFLLNWHVIPESTGDWVEWFGKFNGIAGAIIMGVGVMLLATEDWLKVNGE